MDMKQLRQDANQECNSEKSPSGFERSAAPTREILMQPQYYDMNDENYVKVCEDASAARKDEEEVDADIDSRNKQENLVKPKSNDYGISRDDIQKHAGKRLRDVANIYGISLSAMKQVCRNHGISRWPVRPINRLSASKIMKFKRTLFPQQVPPCFDESCSGVQPNSPSLGPKSDVPNCSGVDAQSSPFSAAQDYMSLDPKTT